MTVPQPPITPLQALALCGDDRATASGWTYYLEDGAAVAVAPGYTDEPLVPEMGVFFTSGEPDDPVDEDSYWVQV